MLDIRRREVDIQQRVDEIEADRGARLKVILNQQSEMTVLRQRIDEVEADREARLKVIHDQLEQSAGSIKELKSEIAQPQTVRGAVHVLLRRSTLH